MSQLLNTIDARTKLAGTNKLEMLLFSLGVDQRTGRRETYGINVFKVREVMRTPPITRAPEMSASVEGMVSLRGALLPVVDLGRHLGIVTEEPRAIMIVTEYNGRTQGFVVESVDTILRLDWSAMRVPPQMVETQSGGLVTAVTELNDGKLVMMLDVERVLVETTGVDMKGGFSNISPLEPDRYTVFYADDSTTARAQIEKTLELMCVRGIAAVNGREAWLALNKMADEAEASGRPLNETLHTIISDVEMPEMDGYILTKKIKGDARFKGIPVIMHSSLSGAANQDLGKSVGADEYVAKFHAERLSATLTRLLTGRATDA